MSSENLDPSHDVAMTSAPLMTSTVVSKPGQNQMSKSSGDSEMPPPSVTAPNREQARSKVGRNLLGATASSNSPLTPKYEFTSILCWFHAVSDVPEKCTDLVGSSSDLNLTLIANQFRKAPLVILTNRQIYYLIC